MTRRRFARASRVIKVERVITECTTRSPLRARSPPVITIVVRVFSRFFLLRSGNKARRFYGAIERRCRSPEVNHRSPPIVTVRRRERLTSPACTRSRTVFAYVSIVYRYRLKLERSSCHRDTDGKTGGRDSPCDCRSHLKRIVFTVWMFATDSHDDRALFHDFRCRVVARTCEIR